LENTALNLQIIIHDAQIKRLQFWGWSSPGHNLCTEYPIYLIYLLLGRFQLFMEFFITWHRKTRRAILNQHPQIGI